jgi:hypothetical protein
LFTDCRSGFRFQSLNHFLNLSHSGLRSKNYHQCVNSWFGFPNGCLSSLFYPNPMCCPTGCQHCLMLHLSHYPMRYLNRTGHYLILSLL